MATNEEVLRNSTKVAQDAAKMLGGTFQQGVGFTPSTAPTSGPGAVTNDAFSETVQNRLLAQSDVISSSDASVDASFGKAIAGTQRAQELSAQRIESAFGRERAFQEGQAGQAIQGQLEGRSGFGTQMIALRNLVETTDKELKDLDQRKNELILQGESAAASQIAGLQVQALQFKQQAQQQTFSNLLSMGTLGVQQRQLTQQQQQFEQKMQYDETTAMSSIALQYGLSTQPGEDLTSLYSRASKDMGVNSPAALAIKQAKSIIDRNNAEISSIQSQMAKDNTIVSKEDREIIARAIAANPEATSGLLSQLSNATEMADILTLSGEIGAKSAAKDAKDSQISKTEYISSIREDKKMSPSDKATAILAAQKVYGIDRPMPIDRRSTSTKIVDKMGNILDWYGRVFLAEPGN